MRLHFLIRTHVAILCASTLLLFSIFVLRDLYATSREERTTILAGYISQLRGMAAYSGNKKTGATSVLILTYMRSGSSLAGDILQQAPDSFYVYEPFRSIGERPTTLRYVNGTVRIPPFDVSTVRTEAMVNWFTCEMEKLPRRSLTDIFMKFGKKTKEMKDCLDKYKLLLVPEEERFHICGQELQKACLDSPIRIIKTIRVELQSVSHLLESLPNLKIVHLVRDPRATLNSQRQLGRCSLALGGLPGCTSSYCKRLENDVLEEERLMKLYPGRIRPIFYEDIAKHPIETAKTMFDFIGSTLTEEARNYIFNITMAGNDNSCIICTTRSNSSEHIDTWKTAMKPEFINIVQDRCNYILKRYNFELLKTDNT